MNYAQSLNDFLVDAAAQGEMGAIKHLLRSYKVDINSRNTNGLTALFAASISGIPDVVEFLIQLGADVNRKNGPPRNVGQRNFYIEGQTPLHAAAASNHIHILEILLQKGADINAQDRKGQTPLMEAVQFGNPATVEFLLLHNANPNLRTTTYHTAFQIAKEMGREDMIRIFQNVAKRMTAEVVAAPRVGPSVLLPPGFSSRLAEFTVPKGGRTRKARKASRRRKSLKN